ncbi:MAG: cytochrome P450 [Myxococcaceae bacterium]|nr:cytochrome P450 [Myxococcaceae bacterium]
MLLVSSPRRPSGWHPLIGHGLTMMRDPLAALERWAREEGDVYRLSFPGFHNWAVNHPDHIEQILTAPSGTRKDRDVERLKSLLGLGLLTSEGDFWRRQRRLAQPAFHRDRIARYAEQMVSLAEAWSGPSRSGEVLDMSHALMALTLEIATTTLFSDGSVSGDDIGRALDDVMARYSGLTYLAPDWVPLPAHRRYRAAVARLHRLVDAVISRRRGSGMDGDDLLGMFLTARDQDGSRMNDQQLRDEVLTMVLAGHETTSNALSWTLHLLSQNPVVEGELQDEVRALGGPPSARDVNRLELCSAVISETMRLFPPAWVLGRALTRDWEVGPHRIPAGEEVLVSQWVIHRDARWFPEPLQFRPRRWLDGSTRDLPAYAYFPFGGGQRMCIGKGFALMEATLVLASLLRRFRFEAVAPEKVKPLPSITLRVQGGLPLRVHRR